MEIRKDPFAIKRMLAETPAMVTASLQPYEIKREQLAGKLALGTGQFGKVYLADYSRDGVATRVAVKLAKLQTQPAEQDEFFSEAEIMVSLSHPCILKASAYFDVSLSLYCNIFTDDRCVCRSKAMAVCCRVYGVQGSRPCDASMQEGRDSAPTQRSTDVSNPDSRWLQIPCICL